MPSPYSNNLRQKVLDAIDNGYRKSHVSRLFNISCNTIDLWLKRREQTGSVGAIHDYRRSPQGKIADLEQWILDGCLAPFSLEVGGENLILYEAIAPTS